jgi:hypothetical protein
MMQDSIRVGTRVYKNGGYTDPSFVGYEPIIIMTKGASPWWELSPYFLKSDEGVIMENEWQFSKVYKVSPKNTEKNSYNGRISWSQEEEIHVDDKGNLTDAYFKWRERGFKHQEWVRYPPGRKNMKLCVGSYRVGEPRLLTYLESRLKVYCPLYISQVRKQLKYQKIIQKLKEGKKILIIEVDGPRQNDLEYYKQKYNVGDDFIVNSTMIANSSNLAIMLQDPMNPFGHGYAFAWSLLIDFGLV